MSDVSGKALLTFNPVSHIATTLAKNIDLVKSLGADEVIEYNKEDFGKKLNDVDLVFDAIGGDTQSRSWRVIRKVGIGFHSWSR